MNDTEKESNSKDQTHTEPAFRSDHARKAEDDLSPAAREVWSDIESAREWDALNEGSNALASQMSPQDIDPLINIGRRGTAEERYVALRALLRVARTPETLSAEQKTRLVQAAYATVQEFYLRQSVGTTSLRILYEHDRQKAQEFLLEEFEPGELTLSALKEYVSDLVQFRGITALQALRAREGEVGLAARSGLERLGIIDPTDLDAAFKEWRETRTAKALHRVCSLYVSRRPEGRRHPWPEFLKISALRPATRACPTGGMPLTPTSVCSSKPTKGSSSPGS